MAKIQFLTQKYTNTFSAKLWTFGTVCGSSQARKLHRYLGFPISDNDVRASLLSDSLFLAERICRAELGKVFPWDMHIPKKKWLSSLSSKYFYCVVGIFWRNQHHSVGILSSPTQMTFSPISSFLDIRCAVPYAMVMVEATVIRLQKVTYISDKRRILPYYLRTCRCKEWSTKMKIETYLFPSKFLVSCWVFVTSKSVWKALQDHPSPSLTCSSSWAEDNLHIFRQMTLTRGTSSSITNRPFGEKESISSRPPTYCW